MKTGKNDGWDMSNDADNDNVVSLQTDPEQSQANWGDLHDGNAALAQKPVEDPLSPPLLPAVVKPNLPLARLHGFVVSDALSLAALGLGDLSKPSKRAGADGVAPAAARRGTNTGRRQPGTRAGARHRHPQSAADVANLKAPALQQPAAPEPRQPMTNQPGFVIGLIAATLVGGLLYIHLT